MRPVKLTPDFVPVAEGSVLIEVGQTRVICTATVDDGVPGFLKGSGKGWVTSEYGMLPRATEERTPREAARGKQSGRTLEIQRLVAAGILKSSPLTDTVAAISVGIVDDRALLDLAYEEDSRAEVDMNVVMTGSGHFVEIQATAEGRPFAR